MTNRQTNPMKIVTLAFWIWILSSAFHVAAADVLSPIQAVTIGDGVDLTLNRIIPAGKDTLGGSAYTEYNLTLTNRSDAEFVVLNIAIMANGHRFMVRNLDEIVLQGDPENPRAEDPVKWRDELEKRGFFGMADGISIMPKKSATNSIWVKQSKDETATKINLYLFDATKSSNRRLVRFDLGKTTP